jgi:leucyl/phenylalanyl-tRNA--protein transferase
MLLSAYEQGIFPWFSEGDPILWWSPDPRFVLFPEALHVSKSMEKILRKGLFRIETDTDFVSVIRGCSQQPRRGQQGTWITEEMIAAYTALHDLGWAHSAEAYLEGRLVGGCYGMRLGKAFFGESMFALEPNASKAAFLTLAVGLFSDGVEFIDCQVPTDHLRSLGAAEMPRESFLQALDVALGCGRPRSDRDDRRGKWRSAAVPVPEF